MEKQDLIIGQKYRVSFGVAKLRGFDKGGDPILEPVIDCRAYTKDTEEDLQEDDTLIIGCFRIFMNTFLDSTRAIDQSSLHLR